MLDGIQVPDLDDARIEAAVRTVLGSMSGDMSVGEAALLAQLADVGREVARAKTEIAALRVGDIDASHIPGATDELDAVLSHTATATNEILDCCETLEGLQPRLTGADAEALSSAVTRIYEACSFQDITGQRIGKVVAALKAIENRVATVTAAFGLGGWCRRRHRYWYRQQRPRRHPRPRGSVWRRVRRCRPRRPPRRR